jgi:hypothetical protein
MRLVFDHDLNPDTLPVWTGWLRSPFDIGEAYSDDAIAISTGAAGDRRTDPETPPS